MPGERLFCLTLRLLTEKKIGAGILEVTTVARSTEQDQEKHDSRFKVRLTISKGPDKNRPITNYVVNMSTGGMFIEASKMLPVEPCSL